MQPVPFRANALGLVFVPLYDALKPMSALLPAPIVPFHAALVMVTDDPDCACTPDQPLVMIWPDGKVNGSLQLDSADELKWVNVTEAVRPEPQSLAYFTVQAPASVGVGVTVGVGVAVGVGVTVGVGVGVTVAIGVMVGVGVGVAVAVRVGGGVGTVQVTFPTTIPRPFVLTYTRP